MVFGQVLKKAIDFYPKILKTPKKIIQKFIYFLV